MTPPHDAAVYRGRGRTGRHSRYLGWKTRRQHHGQRRSTRGHHQGRGERWEIFGVPTDAASTRSRRGGSNGDEVGVRERTICAESFYAPLEADDRPLRSFTRPPSAAAVATGPAAEPATPHLATPTSAQVRTQVFAFVSVRCVRVYTAGLAYDGYPHGWRSYGSYPCPDAFEFGGILGGR